MRTLIFITLVMTASPVVAANSISFVHCSANVAVIDYTVDDASSDSHIVVWDGSTASNKVEVAVSAPIGGRIEQDFASEWGGSSNANISAYLITSSSVTASCDDD